ncbi:MAG TPA: hypothetical protein VHZ95_17945 [Polyangiales bacterium]|nr:hypothetical protein [Polyangiales bacterium]
MIAETECVRPSFGAPLWAAVAFVLTTSTVRANDVSDELRVGRLEGATKGDTTSYWSDRVHGSADLTPDVGVDLGGSITHYGMSQGVTRGDIFQVSTGATYTPIDELAFDLDLALSPTSVNVERDVQVTQLRKGAMRDKTSVLSFDLDAEYNSAGDSDAETIVGLAIGATDYSTTQAVRLRRLRLQAMRAMFGQPEDASLLQWQVDLSVTETLFQDTDVALAGTYYLYNRDTANSGYYGESVFGRLDIGDGIPTLPLRYAIRPSLTQRVGPLQVRLLFQYGDYADDRGTSWMGGVKVQCKIGHPVRLWLSANVQHDRVDGETLNNLWLSLGFRWILS